MRAASWLPPTPGIATPRSPTRTSLGSFLAAAFIAAPGFMAGGWWPRRKAAAPPPVPDEAYPFTVEDCVAAADRAMGEGRWPAAAEWLGRAHRLAPTSARVCADLGFALRQLGDAEGALRMYAQAAACGTDALGGEPHFHAAMACIAAGRPIEEAETWVLRAFEVEPDLAFVVDGEEFEALRGRPAFEAALQDARRVASGGTRV